MTAPPFARRELLLTANEQLGAYRLLRVAAPAGDGPAPGQFAMIAAAESWGAGADERPYLPRAFSIARASADEWHFMLEDVGPGTHRLGQLEAGEGLLALGPLGRPFTTPGTEEQPILVGGGVGTAPLAILQDRLGASAPALLGFRDAAHAEGAQLLAGARVATDDGSVGHDGRVTDLLAAELETTARPRVYACGPPAMLEAVRAMCEQAGVPAELALEAGMACGFGACFGCVVPRRGGGYLRVCVDGPVVDAALLDRVVEPGAFDGAPVGSLR